MLFRLCHLSISIGNTNHHRYNNIAIYIQFSYCGLFNHRHSCLSSSLLLQSIFPFYYSFPPLIIPVSAPFLLLASLRLPSLPFLSIARFIRSAHLLNDTLNHWFVKSMFYFPFSTICKFVGLKICLCIYTLFYFDQNCCRIFLFSLIKIL
jgi:hypothetical protein